MPRRHLIICPVRLWGNTKTKVRKAIKKAADLLNLYAK